MDNTIYCMALLPFSNICQQKQPLTHPSLSLLEHESFHSTLLPNPSPQNLSFLSSSPSNGFHSHTLFTPTHNLCSLLTPFKPKQPLHSLSHLSLRHQDHPPTRHLIVSFPPQHQLPCDISHRVV